MPKFLINIKFIVILKINKEFAKFFEKFFLDFKIVQTNL